MGPTERKKRNWPGIYSNKNKAGLPVGYIVDLGLQSIAGNEKPKRIRFFYKTLREAQTKAEQIRIARKNEGLSAITLPTLDRIDYERARQILSPLSANFDPGCRILPQTPSDDQPKAFDQ